MNPSVEKRIEQAWASCNTWISEFDGAPTVALLVNAPLEAVNSAIAAISGEAENLRITVIPADTPAQPRFIEPDTLDEHVRRLQNGENAQVSINWAVRQIEFDLDLHLVIHPLNSVLVSIELDWWSDQVFSSEANPLTQFRALAAYFILLQERFAAQHLYLSSEGSLDPASRENDWLEI